MAKTFPWELDNKEERLSALSKMPPQPWEEEQGEISKYLPVGLKDIPRSVKNVIQEPSRESISDLLFNISRAGASTLKTIFGEHPAETTGLTPLSLAQIKAFHGSPYKFSKFENKAIGTGEGAQAFGYGHYLTESPEVAKTYARPLPASVKQKFGDAWSAVWLYHSGDKTTALKEIDDLIRVQGNYIQKYNPKTKEPFEALENFKNIKQQMVEGKLEVPSNIYEATIHKGKQPSEYTFLEWDKGIDGQTAKKLNNALKLEETELPQGGFHIDITEGIPGSIVYKRLLERFGEKWASSFLNKNGISGIKYSTGSLSGMKGTGKYNYVVFNPEDITIEKILPPGIEK